MRYINLMIQTINTLREKCLFRQAAALDGILYRNAQELGDLDPSGEFDLGGGESATDLGGDTDLGDEEQDIDFSPNEEPAEPEKELVTEDVSPAQEKMQRTLYYMFVKWHQVLDRELPEFEYFGEENVDAIRSQLRNTRQSFEAAMERRQAHFDKQSIDNWNEEVQQKVYRMHKSQKMPLNETKAKVDAFLLYRPTKDLYDKFLRLCKDDDTFSNVEQEFRSLIHVFSNVIKNTSEEIAEVDLTEER